LDSKTAEGKQVLLHEMTHIAQARNAARGVPVAARGDAEAEADAIATRGTASPPSLAIDLGRRAAADSGGKGKSKNDGPDLSKVPYQWVPGTFQIWVKRSWITSAPDHKVTAGRHSAPSRF